MSPENIQEKRYIRAFCVPFMELLAQKEDEKLFFRDPILKAAAERICKELWEAPNSRVRIAYLNNLDQEWIASLVRNISKVERVRTAALYPQTMKLMQTIEKSKKIIKREIETLACAGDGTIDEWQRCFGVVEPKPEPMSAKPVEDLPQQVKEVYPSVSVEEFFAKIENVKRPEVNTHLIQDTIIRTIERKDPNRENKYDPIAVFGKNVELSDETLAEVNRLLQQAREVHEKITRKAPLHIERLTWAGSQIEELAYQFDKYKNSKERETRYARPFGQSLLEVYKFANDPTTYLKSKYHPVEDLKIENIHRDFQKDAKIAEPTPNEHQTIVVAPAEETPEVQAVKVAQAVQPDPEIAVGVVAQPLPDKELSKMVVKQGTWNRFGEIIKNFFSRFGRKTENKDLLPEVVFTKVEIPQVESVLPRGAMRRALDVLSEETPHPPEVEDPTELIRIAGEKPSEPVVSEPSITVASVEPAASHSGNRFVNRGIEKARNVLADNSEWQKRVVDLVSEYKRSEKILPRLRELFLKYDLPQDLQNILEDAEVQDYLEELPIIITKLQSAKQTPAGTRA